MSKQVTKRKRKEPYNSMVDMLNERALNMLTPYERQEILTPNEQTSKEVCDQMNHFTDEVKEWSKKRFKNGNITFTYPTFIWLQPDLSELEKILLGDIWNLQKMKMGCFKSNEAFAIELGVSTKVAANMIAHLKACGFLTTKPDRKRRLLCVSDNIIPKEESWERGLLGGKNGKSESSEHDRVITGKLSSDHRDVNNTSYSGDSMQGSIRSEYIEEEHVARREKQPNLQETLFKSTTTNRKFSEETKDVVVDGEQNNRGAAAPQTPCRKASLPGNLHSNAASAPAAQAADNVQVKRETKTCQTKSTNQALPANSKKLVETTGQATPLAQQADRFLKIYGNFYQKKYVKHLQVTDEDRIAACNFFQESGWSVPATLYVAILSWRLVGKAADNGFRYGVCQQPGKIHGILDNFDKVCRYLTDEEYDPTTANTIWIHYLLNDLAHVSGQSECELETIFSPELEKERVARRNNNEKQWIEYRPDFEKELEGYSMRWEALKPGQRNFLKRYWHQYYLFQGKDITTFKEDMEAVTKRPGLENESAHDAFLDGLWEIFINWYVFQYELKNERASLDDVPTRPTLEKILEDSNHAAAEIVVAAKISRPDEVQNYLAKTPQQLRRLPQGPDDLDEPEIEMENNRRADQARQAARPLPRGPDDE